MKKAPTIQAQKSKKPSQLDEIRAALLRGERLTPIDALRDFGCFRLSGRIYDLKAEGFDVRDETIQVKRGGSYVKRYYLEPDYLEARRAHEACHESQELPDNDNEGGLAR